MDFPNHGFYQKILLNQTAAGDERAFAILMKLFHKPIYTAAIRLTRNQRLSEEIVQDVFLKIWIKRTTLPEIENFAAYLNTVAARTIYSALRSFIRERNRRNKMARFETVVNADPSDLLYQKEFMALVQQAVEQLPEKQRLTYQLIKEQGLKREEAAMVLKVSAETIKSNLDQAMKSIRTYCRSHMELFIFILLVCSEK